MYNIGDYVVYNKNICVICDLKENYIRGHDYYILKPLNDDSLKIDVPVNSDTLRKPLTLEEANALIDDMINILPIESNERFIENEYWKLLSTNSHEDLIKIIKTSYLRNKKRMDNNKKTSSRDSEFLELAEKYLYSELGLSLGLSFEDIKDYIINKLSSL